MVTGDEVIWEEVLATRKSWEKKLGAEMQFSLCS